MNAGLCDACGHQKKLLSKRGSGFSLCQLSRVDARFRRYPLIPVVSCSGFELRDEQVLSEQHEPNDEVEP